MPLTSQHQREFATADDVPALHQLRQEVEEWLADKRIEQWPRGILTADEIATQVRRAEWLLHRTPAGTVAAAMRVLWSDPEVWGLDDTRAVYVHGLMVDRACSGRNLGTVMLDAAERMGRDNGAAVCRLDCVTHDTGLREYYRHRGFTEVGRHSYTEQVTSVLLEKPL